MEPLLYLKAFAVGGLLCVAGQLLLSLTRLTSARVLVLFVTLGVVLGALGWYQPLVEFAGAGATVPLTGFGNTLARGALQGARVHGALGAFLGGRHRRGDPVWLSLFAAVALAHQMKKMPAGGDPPAGRARAARQPIFSIFTELTRKR